MSDYYGRLFSCHPVDCNYKVTQNSTHFYDADANECLPNDDNDSKVELNLVGYTCQMADAVVSASNGTIVKRRTGAYSESATLFFGTGEQGRGRQTVSSDD